MKPVLAVSDQGWYLQEANRIKDLSELASRDKKIKAG
jgi:hypothetical protein